MNIGTCSTQIWKVIGIRDETKDEEGDKRKKKLALKVDEEDLNYMKV